MSSIVDTPYSNLPQPASGWALFKSLATGAITPGLAWQNPSYRRKFMLRSLASLSAPLACWQAWQSNRV